MVDSVYRVLNVYEENNKYIFSLQLSRVIQEDMQILLNYLQAHRKISIDGNTNLITFVDILQAMDKIDLLEKFVKRTSNEMLMNAKIESMHVMEIGKYLFIYLRRIARDRNRYDEALEQFNTALKYIYLMTESDSTTVAVIYTAMAANFDLKHRYSAALHYYNRAIDILRENENENASKLAKALALREKYLLEMHYKLAYTYQGLAAIYFDLYEYDQALINCEKALDIELKSLPLDHPDIATTYESMTVICEHIGDVERAKDFMTKASIIDHQSIMTPCSRFACTMYICPWCNHHVWIYNIFRFVKGAPRFQCLGRKIGIHR